ncbi:MAG: hypothetical protein QXV21_01205 [Candidatus Bathyarchaeia archaeon]
MSEGILEFIVSLVSLGGGLAGYASFVYLLWKKFRKKNFIVYDISGFYKTKDSQIKGFNDITAVIDVAFFNDTDETLSVTDVIGTLKYNKELYEKLVSNINIPRIPDVYSERPRNFEEVGAFSIPPHETIKKKIVIEFPNMILDYIDRKGWAHFVGFLSNGKTPLLHANTKELKEKWSTHPLVMLLTVHVNAKKEYRRYVQLFKEDEKISAGTFNIVDIKRIEKDYREHF